LAISVVFDKVTSELIISDTGIGMTRTELIKCTDMFSKDAAETLVLTMMTNEGSWVIDTDRVGYASGYFITAQLTVVKRRDGDEQYILTPSANGWFCVRRDIDKTHGDIEHGTKIICHLKREQMELPDEWLLARKVRKYGKFVGANVKFNVAFEQTEACDFLDEQPASALKGKSDFELGYECGYIFYEDPDALPNCWAVGHVDSTGQIELRSLVRVPRFTTGGPTVAMKGPRY
jgi:HSP90 family molecular chaperone